jgi:hypothetical protein
MRSALSTSTRKDLALVLLLTVAAFVLAGAVELHETHQTMIKEKLGVSTTAALVHLAIRHGVIAADGS